MRTVPELMQHLHRTGQKVTSQRLLIYRHLEGNTDHPTAEQIYDAVRETLPTISLTTVYKTLNELVESGDIRRVDLGDGAAHFDPNTQRHIHARCLRCGEIFDLPVERAPVRIPRHADGFTVRSYQLLLEGECAACSSA